MHIIMMEKDKLYLMCNFNDVYLENIMDGKRVPSGDIFLNKRVTLI